ncbi:dedicator of cytokinesis protein 6-like [Temnothorax longispinosus]|uniref:dedicator of cytokinesis protein 6-like n=1 Tax=Temnothorax longispinosus TaxID=300112 RepID=UPI003A99F413
MAQQHMERKNHTEAAMCLVHSAALVVEYLHLLELGDGVRLVGAVALNAVTPNALEESAVGDDVLIRKEEGFCLNPDFSESGLAGLLEHAPSFFYATGMYEAIPDVYRVLLPIAEAAHDYNKLANIHGKLHETYTRVEQLAGKRVFGTYFRVGFYGARFGDLAGEVCLQRTNFNKTFGNILETRELLCREIRRGEYSYNKGFESCGS